MSSDGAPLSWSVRSQDLTARVSLTRRSFLRNAGAAAALIACSPKEQTTPGVGTSELDRLAAQAARIEIIRDDFGIPHVYGKTDADAVFGMLYAQAEDDFPRVERNYIWAIGRLAEVDGEAAIYSDVRARLTSNTAIAKMTEQMNRVAEEASKVRGRVAEATSDATDAVTKFQTEQRERLEARMERMREALGLKQFSMK